MHRYYIENIEAEYTDTTLNLRRKMILFFRQCTGTTLINNSVIFHKNYANVVGKERERKKKEETIPHDKQLGFFMRNQWHPIKQLGDLNCFDWTKMTT